MFDVIIIGAGPAGISAAYEAKKANLDYLVIEKGLIGNTVYNYPVGLTVFSTTNELEFVKGELKPSRKKPTREELLSYYVRFVLDNELNVRTEEAVTSVTKSSPPYEGWVDALAFLEGGRGGSLRRYEDTAPVELRPADREPPRQQKTLTPLLRTEGSSDGDPTVSPHFTVITGKAEYKSRSVLFAIGAMDYPRKLNVPGEELPKVHDQFRETYPWVKKRALIVGGGNSAGEAALFLAEEGADTTLAIFRSDWENNDPKQGCIKYWVKQPLEDELKKHCLKLFFLGKLIEIREDDVVLEEEDGTIDVLPNDVVFVLIGSDADLTLLKGLGVETTTGKNGEVPVYDEETFETNVPGIFVAGHFTNHRHIKAAIDASKVLIPKLAERIKGKMQKPARK